MVGNNPKIVISGDQGLCTTLVTGPRLYWQLSDWDHWEPLGHWCVTKLKTKNKLPRSARSKQLTLDFGPDKHSNLKTNWTETSFLEFLRVYYVDHGIVQCVSWQLEWLPPDWRVTVLLLVSLSTLSPDICDANYIQNRGSLCPASAVCHTFYIDTSSWIK